MRPASQDEFPLYYGKAIQRGFSRGELYCEEVHKKGAGKLNVHIVISCTGIVKIWPFSENTDDAVCVKFMCGTQKPSEKTPHLGGPPVPQLVPAGHILFWDKLGRAGLAADPQKQHYNPEIKRAFYDAGIGCDLLPAKGANVNPVELCNGFIQRAVARWMPATVRRDSYGHLVRGPQTAHECRQALDDVVADLRANPALFRHWYHRRALGADAEARWKNLPAAQAVKNARAVSGAAARTYDVANAFKPTYIHTHGVGAPTI